MAPELPLPVKAALYTRCFAISLWAITRSLQKWPERHLPVKGFLGTRASGTVKLYISGTPGEVFLSSAIVKFLKRIYFAFIVKEGTNVF